MVGDPTSDHPLMKLYMWDGKFTVTTIYRPTACNSFNQVVTRVQKCYRADTILLQLLQATKLPGVSRPL